MGHLRENGFKVKTVATDDLAAVKVQHGVRPQLQACHTAVVEGYIIEGHVPADVITRLLDERPAFVGLSVPGMPMGSPGMDGSYSEPYDVLGFDGAGNTEVYASR